MTAKLPIDQVLSGLMSRLREAPAFEPAAAALLRSILDLAAGSLAESPFHAQGRIVRAMLHVRPDDGYRRLAVLEGDASALSPSGVPAPLAPSATAWRWVAEHERALSVDVNLGQVRVEGEDAGAVLEGRFGNGELAGQESRGRLLDRAVSHLFVLPLRGVRGAIDGMVSVEADCRRAMGRPFIWSACAPSMQLLADAAAPHVTSVPLASSVEEPTDPFLPVIGRAMAEVVELLRVFVRHADPILISGPTGVGKSRLARWCHERSAVRAGPFEMLDLSALPEELQLAELFGWRKGAFTGAVRDHAGVFARAEGGTLFLDEIDNLSPRAQAGLLQALEERTYRVLGDEAGPRKADVRILVGTNARLQEAVRQKRFREDLYYRINVLPVRLPPLRERLDEIGPWARHFIARHHQARFPAGRVVFAPGVEALLVRQPWPGNLRQLDNILRRAYAIAIMPYAETPAEVTVREEHVRHALAYDDEGGRVPLLDALVAAAAAFVAEVESRGQGAGMDLDLADAFKGFVLGVATEKLGGDRDQAFRLLGREALLAGRNHHKVYKRELERVEALCVALGGEPLPFALLPSKGPDGKGAP